MIPVIDIDRVGEAAAALRAGRVVAFATETVYGLGANALDAGAVARVFELKGRPRFDPLIVHVADADAVRGLVTDFPEAARVLAAAFWPGPLTLVLPKQPTVPDLVTAGLGTVAVRVPAHPAAQALIREAGLPIAAPSANRFGGVSPTRAEHVRDEFAACGPAEIACIVDGGPCETGVESTVVSLAGDEPVVLRPGGVTQERIEAALGRPVAVAGGVAGV
ncbi:MAG: L-threonylcarbamoyladenylate synthase, partial [Phycisphaeraceae bacterium]